MSGVSLALYLHGNLGFKLLLVLAGATLSASGLVARSHLAAVAPDLQYLASRCHNVLFSAVVFVAFSMYSVAAASALSNKRANGAAHYIAIFR